MRGISQTDFQIIVEWLRSLGVLCAGSMSADEARTRCGAYADMIQTEFPVAAFNRATLQAVAARAKFFPAYGELVAALREVWRDLTPQRTALPPPAREDGLPPLDARAHAWMAVWQNAKSAGFSPECHPFNGRPTPCYSDVHPDTPDNHRRAHLASLIRHCSPAAWAHIQAGKAG